MKKSIGSMFLLFVLLTVLAMSGCAPAPTPEPTSTPLPPTFTPEPTATSTVTPTVTPTPLPPALTDGTNIWPVLAVSFLDTVKIEGYDRTAEPGKAFLLVEFDASEDQVFPDDYPNPPTLPNSNKTDYSQIYVTDSQGNKYIAVGDGIKMEPIPGSSGFRPSDFAYWFEAMPKDSHGFTLYFANYPPVVLGK